ncbi:hypothetical protein ACM614_15005 [Streptomyces sp. 12297]
MVTHALRGAGVLGSDVGQHFTGAGRRREPRAAQQQDVVAVDHVALAASRCSRRTGPA